MSASKVPPSLSSPATTGSGSGFNLRDDQKRWLVTGICLNKVLLPALRDSLDPEMIKHYTHLRTTQNIDKQSHAKHLMKDGKCNLNYGSINNNEATHKKKTRLYDYDVKSAVDLAKLYLQPFMAKFSGFDDTCDLSAVLGILSSASVFSPAVQGLSSDVRKDVRNKWGHCNFKLWTKTKFAKCFQQMESLVRALTLSPAAEKRITDELQDWETKGLQLCMGNIVDADLVKFIETEVAQLTENVRQLAKSQGDEALRVSNALQSVQEALKEYKQEMNKTLESLKESQDNLSQRVDDVVERVLVLETATETESAAEDRKTKVLPDDEKYDAFICYAGKDIEFAREILRILESEPYDLRLCIDYRDILPGGAYLSTVAQIIEEICRKVVVILSEYFNGDETADFQAKIALCLSPGCRDKRLIPIKYENCKIPIIYRFITHLDYTNEYAKEYLWPNLARSLGYSPR